MHGIIPWTAESESRRIPHTWQTAMLLRDYPNELFFKVKYGFAPRRRSVSELIDQYERSHPDCRVDTAVPIDWLMEDPESRRDHGWHYGPGESLFGRPISYKEMARRVNLNALPW